MAKSKVYQIRWLLIRPALTGPIKWPVKIFLPEFMALTIPLLKMGEEIGLGRRDYEIKKV